MSKDRCRDRKVDRYIGRVDWIDGLGGLAG